MTPIVAKTSAGAVEYVPMVRVANITSAIGDLKKAGIWVYGATNSGEKTLWETDLTGPTAVVIGSEGGGMSRLVEERCDFLVRIPMVGKISSLNASVSASVILFEALRQRGHE